jgi:hypothetical protein
LQKLVVWFVVFVFLGEAFLRILSLEFKSILIFIIVGKAFLSFEFGIEVNLWFLSFWEKWFWINLEHYFLFGLHISKSSIKIIAFSVLLCWSWALQLFCECEFWNFFSFVIFNLCALYTSSMYGLHILKVEFSLWFSFALQDFPLPNLSLFFCVLFSFYNCKCNFSMYSQSFNHNGWVASFVFVLFYCNFLFCLQVVVIRS